MGNIYRVHERNSKLHYYNNTLDYYTLNYTIIIIVLLGMFHPWSLANLETKE
jgi:hypothetical protein